MGYTVYCHTFPNGKKYIGITGQPVSRRWRGGEGYEGQPVYNAILKYRWENIKHEILFENLSKEEAEKKEIELIEKYKTKSHTNGYNIESGGSSPGKMSDETKHKSSEAHKGLMAGEKHWHYGQHWSDEVKKKISDAHKGKKISAEVRMKESIMFSGKGNPMYGTKMSKEHQQKFQEACVKAHSKPVMCIETGCVYESAAQAQRCTGINSRTIGYVVNRDKRYKTAGGYHWEYQKGGGSE